MTAYVVETNVAIVANDRPDDTPQANPKCVLSCIKQLRKCIAILDGQVNGKLVLDNCGEIEREYAVHLSRSGQPGTGDEFFYQVNLRGYGSHCERVSITPSGDSYEEFPNDPRLKGFDRSDRKFVATALASERNPIILNAVDSDWRHFQEAMESCGVRIKQLCPDCLG